jgi:hypothetical protein
MECFSLREVIFEEPSCLREIEPMAFMHCIIPTIRIPPKCEIVSGLSLFCVRHASLSPENPFLVMDTIPGGFRLMNRSRNLAIAYFHNFGVKFPERAPFGCGRSERSKFQKCFRYEIPSSVESIGGGCFQGCELGTRILWAGNSNVKQICERAFAESGIISIRIPRSVEVIEALCFFGSRLRAVSFEENCNLKTIGRKAFSSSRLANVQIPSSVETVGEDCFDSYTIGHVAFEPDSKLTYFSAGMFYGSSLMCIEVPANITDIGNACFHDCGKLYEITFASGSKLTRIGYRAFYRSGLKSIRIPASVEYLESYCFGKCRRFRDVTFESGSRLKRIGYSLCNESGLRRVQIPSTIEKIEWTSIVGGDCSREPLSDSICELAFENQSLSEEEMKLVEICQHAEVRYGVNLASRF